MSQNTTSTATKIDTSGGNSDVVMSGSRTDGFVDPTNSPRVSHVVSPGQTLVDKLKSMLQKGKFLSNPLQDKSSLLFKYLSKFANFHMIDDIGESMQKVLEELQSERPHLSTP